MYSNTKVVTAAAVWMLVEDGLLRFNDTIAQHVPIRGERQGRHHRAAMLTHQGGFPGAVVPEAAWADHALLRGPSRASPWMDAGQPRAIPPGRGALGRRGADRGDHRPGFREFIRAGHRAARPGRTTSSSACRKRSRAAPPTSTTRRSTAVSRAHAGEHGGRPRRGHPRRRRLWQARGMAAFYQMLAQGGVLGGMRVLSPRMIEFVTRNFTGDRIDEYMGLPMHRGIGPHSRGEPPSCAASAPSPIRAPSAMAAWAPPIAGPTRPRAVVRLLLELPADRCSTTSGWMCCPTWRMRDPAGLIEGGGGAMLRRQRRLTSIVRTMTPDQRLPSLGGAR